MTKKEHDRAIVERLRAARERKRAADGRCEGAKPYGSRPGEAAVLTGIQQSRAAGATLQSIADGLNYRRIRPRRGVRWHAKTIARIVARAEVKQVEDQNLPLFPLGRIPRIKSGALIDEPRRKPKQDGPGPGALVITKQGLRRMKKPKIVPPLPPFIPFGYERAGGRKSDFIFGELVKVGKKTETHGHRIVESPEEQEIIRRIRYLHEMEGKRYREIAAMLDA